VHPTVALQRTLQLLFRGRSIFEYWSCRSEVSASYNWCSDIRAHHSCCPQVSAPNSCSSAHLIAAVQRSELLRAAGQRSPRLTAAVRRWVYCIFAELLRSQCTLQCLSVASAALQLCTVCSCFSDVSAPYSCCLTIRLELLIATVRDQHTLQLLFRG
jgi:hypothetical protein